MFTLARHLYFLGHVNASHAVLSYFFRSIFISFHLCLDLYFPLGFPVKLRCVRQHTQAGKQFSLDSRTVSLVYEE
jgi:hypothetical protein